MSRDGFLEFDSWKFLLAWAEFGNELYYHAPLDLLPRRVSCKRMGDAIKVTPLVCTDADPFLADEGHMSRFKRADHAPSSDDCEVIPPTLREVRGA
jgi:esterase/lipase superfamily enzyme